MKAIGLALRFALGMVLPVGLAAQDVGTRLDGRVSPEVRRAVQDIAGDAAAQGLPVEPLVQKAIEGGAKGVPADRIIAAVRTLAGRLSEAMEAVSEAGIATPGEAVVQGGADALNAGLDRRQVRDLARASRPPYDPALTLQVAATLAALGVPPKQTVELLQGRMSAGSTPGELLGLPGQVQADMAQGATPAQAAAGLARAAGGTPPGRLPGWVPPGQKKAHPRKP